MAKYTDLFGLEGPVDSGVTDWAEHGRAGNVSTGQPFKHVSLIDPSTGNSLITDGKLDVNATVTATIDPTVGNNPVLVINSSDPNNIVLTKTIGATDYQQSIQTSGSTVTITAWSAV